MLQCSIPSESASIHRIRSARLRYAPILRDMVHHASKRQNYRHTVQGSNLLELAQMYLYTLQTSQLIPIKFIHKRHAAEIRFDGVTHVPKPNGGIQFLRNVSERNAEELSIPGEEAGSGDDSAAHDVVVRDVRAIGLPVFTITSYLSG